MGMEGGRLSGVVRLDQHHQSLLRHQRLHLREKPLSLGLWFDLSQLIVRQAGLLAAHQSSPAFDHRVILTRMVCVF